MIGFYIFSRDFLNQCQWLKIFNCMDIRHEKRIQRHKMKNDEVEKLEKPNTEHIRVVQSIRMG